MNQWSVQRKRIVLAIVVFALIILIGAPGFLIFYQAPSCSDSKQNGDELGVDCGGSCQLLCTAQSLPLIPKGDPRVFEFGPGVYGVAAVVENPNIAAEILHARYTLKLFEKSSLTPARSIESETLVPNNGTFVVFEGPIDIGERRLDRATLEWQTNTFIWQKNTQIIKNVETRNIFLTREDTKPRVSATLINDSLNHISNIELTALVSGEDGNLIAASKTFVERLAAGESVPITFNWLEPFDIKEDFCGYPVDVALVMDRSGSMAFLSANPPQPLTDVKSAARYFTDQLEGNTLYSLVSFANDATNPIDATLNAGLENIKRAINNISIAAIGGVQNTNIGAGILAAREELNSARHRKDASKALVLLTDGVPNLPTKSGAGNYPETYAMESAALARQESISIYTIGLGKDVNKNLLRALATTTAEAYFAPSAEELDGIYKQIAIKICRKNPVAIDIYMRILPDKSFLK
ncbi:MAG: VWA domain-containing protein [Candidatus Zambryskibacteria bacterium]|nr:VWA domain-containing protein [Candidatus Zambryskibacteria bacterium]